MRTFDLTDGSAEIYHSPADLNDFVDVEPIPLPAKRQTKIKRVRAATPEDFEDLLLMCRELYQENGAVNVDWGIVAQVLANGVNGQRSCVGVIGSHDKLEGMIFLNISTMWYSGEPILEELFNYVRPHYRRSTNAKSLISFAKNCAERLNVPLLIGIISTIRTEAKVRLYRRMLGEPRGAFFLYNARK